MAVVPDAEIEVDLVNRAAASGRYLVAGQYAIGNGLGLRYAGPAERKACCQRSTHEHTWKSVCTPVHDVPLQVGHSLRGYCWTGYNHPSDQPPPGSEVKLLWQFPQKLAVVAVVPWLPGWGLKVFVPKTVPLWQVMQLLESSTLSAACPVLPIV